MTDASDLPGASTSQRTMSKLLRQWAQEFLTLRKHANNLIDIISHWDDCTITCLLTLETIFTEVLKRGDMYLERTIALTISEPSAEFRYITWLRNCYEEVWKKVLLSMESSRLTIQLQVLTTAIKLMAEEGRTPLEPCDNPGYHFPLHRLRPILMTLLSPEKDNTNLISRFQEIAGYPDALYYTWKCLPSLTPKRQPQEIYIKNLLELIDKIPVPKEEDAEGSISVLALQGVFILVTKHNLEYPNIFTKLYSMFEPEIFHTKYKARLFYLSDLFLSSTHLPETLVAAFAKRLARLTLVAPPEDILIILLFVGNLLLRHPGLKRLIDHPQGGEVTSYATMGAGDPFLMEERDPLLSNAMLSSLWEIRALQQHILPSVASAAQFIREPLPSVEYDMASALERNSGYIFDRELKSKVKDIMLTFERPTSMALLKGEKLLQYWQLTSTY
ncbi:nucleolar complex protein 4 homolog isoform X2 [Pseudomyrmex gracilis]|uniref:nucleolar complex protein 4 homolog isoform X2 n=1 Tax=Pseudomyrmex gracilis TaxID=219809 RepID=UPI0009952D73|nr:nucleolar complex protein 4 homolog isoform X2 [Pseudomyrmex gracilis]